MILESYCPQMELLRTEYEIFSGPFLINFGASLWPILKLSVQHVTLCAQRTLILVVHRLPSFAWADGNLTEAAVQPNP